MIAELNEEMWILLHTLAIMAIAALTVWLVCHVHDRREAEAKKPKCKHETSVLSVTSKGVADE